MPMGQAHVVSGRSTMPVNQSVSPEVSGWGTVPVNKGYVWSVGGALCQWTRVTCCQ